MKKKFKTIIALTAALAISMSGMYITTAYEEPTPPTTQSVVVDGNPATGEFNDVYPIPVTMNAEHLLSVTIEFTDVKFHYSVKDDSWDEDEYGKEEYICVTNNSTCPITAQLDIVYNTNDYPLLNDLGLPDSSPYKLSLNSGENSGFTFRYLCNFSEDIHKYQFNDVEIGNFVVKIEPNWKTVGPS